MKLLENYRLGLDQGRFIYEAGYFFPTVSDWTNVFIVIWLSYAEEELTYSLALAPDLLTKR